MSVRHLVENYCELPLGVRKPLWRFLHGLLRRFDKDHYGVFLNYGFAYPEGSDSGPELAPADQIHRNPIQLYRYVTRGGGLEGSAVLEVGCGRGGGAAHLAREFQPAEYVGLDISAGTTAFCNTFHRVPGLSFIRGEAERIPFPPDRFDVVVNIESARCYGDLRGFFGEVFRVLRTGGRFLLADMFKRGDQDGARTLLAETGFETTEEEDISENVVLAIKEDSAGRKAFIDAGVPRFLQRGFYEFSGIEGSNRFAAFLDGDFCYWCFSSRKPEVS